MGGYTWYSVWIVGVLGLFDTSLLWTNEVGRWAFRNVHHILQYAVEYFCGYHRRRPHIITIFLIMGSGGVFSLPSRGLSTSTRIAQVLPLSFFFSFFLFFLFLLLVLSSP